MRYISLAGQIFGRLLILDEAKFGNYKCFARCRCGTEKWIEKCHIKSGRTRSCGCLGKPLPYIVPKKPVNFRGIE